MSLNRLVFTGDLTDAKNADMLGSQQYIEEWATYSDILKHSGVLNKTVWLDIRGNHGMKLSCIIFLLIILFIYRILSNLNYH